MQSNIKTSALHPLQRGGFLAVYNALSEHTADLGLDRAEYAVIVGLCHFQEQPQYRYCVPSVTALAKHCRYSREWVSKILAGLQQPRYDDAGRITRPAYVFKILRPGKPPWYDLRRVVRACERFLPPAEERPQPDPIMPLLLNIFAGWHEIDGAPGRTLQRVNNAAVRASWSIQETRTYCAIAADRATRAKPRRHIPLFLDILEKLAEETRLRREAQCVVERQAREAARYWQEQDRARLRAQRQAARAMLPASIPTPVVEEPPIDPRLKQLSTLRAKLAGYMALGTFKTKQHVAELNARITALEQEIGVVFNGC